MNNPDLMPCLQRLHTLAMAHMSLKDEAFMEVCKLFNHLEEGISTLSKPGYKLVPVEKLQELKASINGDCYNGQAWEIFTINELLAAAPDINSQEGR